MTRQTKPKTVEPKQEVKRRFRVAADQGDPMGEQQTKEWTKERQEEEAGKLKALYFSNRPGAQPTSGLRTLEDIGRKVDEIVTVMWLMVGAVVLGLGVGFVAHILG